MRVNEVLIIILERQMSIEIVLGKQRCMAILLLGVLRKEFWGLKKKKKSWERLSLTKSNSFFAAGILRAVNTLVPTMTLCKTVR